MTLGTTMVKFFTLSPITTLKSSTNYFPHKCLTITKGKLVPMQFDRGIGQSRTFAEDKGETKEPAKEEEIQKIKMPGFVHPETHNEEGYFTQKAHQQIEELKKRLEKPTIDNKEKKE